MSYNITGPTRIGTTSRLNEILGDVLLTDIGTNQGTVFFAGSIGPGNLKALLPGVAGQILQTNGINADPSWVNNSGGGGVTNGFLAGKTGSDTFVNTPLQIQNWTVSSPTVGLSANPFYNTSGNFNTTTGVYTAPTTGVYALDAYIEYSNTSPAHGSLKTLTFVEKTSSPINGVIISCGPRQGSGNVDSTEVLHIHAHVQLNAASQYALYIVASTSDITNTMLTSSRFNIDFATS